MNVEKADYGTIIKFGTMQDFNTKLQMEGKTIDEVIDIIDKDGISLLEKSLIARKFDIAKILLANNAKVNNISHEGCNEFHYIASNINHDGALDIEIFKVRSVEGLRFIETCFENVQEYDTCNKAGYSVRMLINERGTDKLKQMMESRI